jgi:hypothetical protein
VLFTSYVQFSLLLKKNERVPPSHPVWSSFGRSPPLPSSSTRLGQASNMGRPTGGPPEATRILAVAGRPT